MSARSLKEFTEPVALSSTAPTDVPLGPCDSHVLPSGSASIYSRSVLGARENLRGRKGRCKRRHARKGRNLRKFNYQHFHSTSCNLWTRLGRPLKRAGAASSIRRLD